MMGQYPMAGCGGGMGVGLLVGLLLLVLVGYIAYRWGQSQPDGESLGRRDGRSEHHRRDEALELARRRYAQGDLTRDDFEQLKRDLH